MKYKQFLLAVMFFSFVSLFILFSIKPINAVELTLFYSNTCPHCHKELTFLDDLEKNYTAYYLKSPPNITRYEIHNKINYELYKKEIEKFNSDLLVPALIIKDKIFIGYSDKIKKEIVSKIKLEEMKEIMAKSIVEYKPEPKKNDLLIITAILVIILVLVTLKLNSL